MFTVTTQAAIQIAKAAEESGAHGMALRIAAKVNPEGGLEFGMGFDEQRVEDMEVVCPAGVNVLIGPKSWDLLKGATMDYVELEPGQFRFIVIPPKPEATPPQDSPKAGGCGSGGCGSGGGASCS